jgi:excisionase family DNA binding protein
MEHDDLITVNGVCALLGVSRATLYRWINTDPHWKRIARRIGGRYRFSTADVLAGDRSKCSGISAAQEPAA